MANRPIKPTCVCHKTTELCLSKPDLIANGFKRSGIFPWNPQAPDQTKLLPGTIFQKPTDATLPPEHDSQVDFTPIMDTTPHDMSLSTPLFDTTSEVPVIPAMDTTRQIMFTPELDITPEIMVKRWTPQPRSGSAQCWRPNHKTWPSLS